MARALSTRERDQIIRDLIESKLGALTSGEMEEELRTFYRVGCKGLNDCTDQELLAEKENILGWAR